MVDFSVLWKLRIDGVKESRAELEEVAASFERGETSVEKFNAAIENHEKQVREGIKVQRSLNDEWKATHPNLALLERDLGRVQRAANGLMSTYNSINFMLIRQNTEAIKGLSIQFDLEQATRRRLILEGTYSKDQLKNSKDYLQALQDQKEAQAKADANKSGDQNDIVNTLFNGGFGAAIALGNVRQAWDLFQSVNQRIGRGRGASGLGRLIGRPPPPPPPATAAGNSPLSGLLQEGSKLPYSSQQSGAIRFTNVKPMEDVIRTTTKATESVGKSAGIFSRIGSTFGSVGARLGGFGARLGLSGISKFLGPIGGAISIGSGVMTSQAMNPDRKLGLDEKLMSTADMAIGGAMTGATIGSVVPGLGTLIGGGIGGAAGGVAGLVMNFGDEMKDMLGNLGKLPEAYAETDAKASQYSDTLKNSTRQMNATNTSLKAMYGNQLRTADAFKDLIGKPIVDTTGISPLTGGASFDGMTPEVQGPPNPFRKKLPEITLVKTSDVENGQVDNSASQEMLPAGPANPFKKSTVTAQKKESKGPLDQFVDFFANLGKIPEAEASSEGIDKLSEKMDKTKTNIGQLTKATDQYEHSIRKVSDTQSGVSGTARLASGPILSLGKATGSASSSASGLTNTYTKMNSVLMDPIKDEDNQPLVKMFTKTIPDAFAGLGTKLTGFFTKDLPDIMTSAGKNLPQIDWASIFPADPENDLGGKLKKLFQTTIPDWVSGTGKWFVETFGPGFQTAWDGIVTTFSTVGEGIGTFLTQTLPSWGTQAYGWMQATFGPAIRTAWEQTVTALGTIGEGINTLFTRKLPEWGNSALTTMRSIVGPGLETAWTGTVTALQTVGEGVKTLFTGSIPQWGSDLLGDVSGRISPGLQTAWDTTVTAFETTAERAKTLFTTSIPTWGSNLLTNVTDTLGPGLKTAWDTTVTAFENSGDRVKTLFTASVPEWGNSVLANIRDTVGPGLKTAWDATVTAYETTGDRVKTLFMTNIPQWGDSLYKNVSGTLSPNLRSTWDATATSFETIGNRIKNLFTVDMPSWGGQTLNWLSTNFGSSNGVWKSATDVFVSVAGDVEDLFTSTIPSWGSQTLGWLERNIGSTNGVWKGAVDAFVGVGASLEDFFTLTIPSWGSQTLGWLENNIGSTNGFWKTAVDTFVSVGAPIQTFFTSSIPSWGQQALDWLSQHLVNPISAWISSLGNINVNVNQNVTTTYSGNQGGGTTSYAGGGGGSSSSLSSSGSGYTSYANSGIGAISNALSSGHNVTGFGATGGVAAGATGTSYASTRMAQGGIITEPIQGVGQKTGRRYLLGEAGQEVVTPIRKFADIVQNRIFGKKGAGGGEEEEDSEAEQNSTIGGTVSSITGRLNSLTTGNSTLMNFQQKQNGRNELNDTISSLLPSRQYAFGMQNNNVAVPEMQSAGRAGGLESPIPTATFGGRGGRGGAGQVVNYNIENHYHIAGSVITRSQLSEQVSRDQKVSSYRQFSGSS